MRSTERDISESGLVSRVAALLAGYTAGDRALSGAELARRAGLPRSTTHRIIGDLVAEGLIERTPTGLYRLGMRLFELGQMAPRQRGIAESAGPYLTDLHNATHETVHLAILDGTEVVYLDIIKATGAPALGSRVGGRLPASATGVGKAILAFSPSRVVQNVIDSGLPRMTPYSITSSRRLLMELDEVRKTGTAYDHEEQTVGATCCASPILGRQGQAIAAISVSGRTVNLQVDRVTAAVRACAVTISRMHGGYRGRVFETMGG